MTSAPQLDRILQACLGLSVQTTLAQAEVVPGEADECRDFPSAWTIPNPVKWIGQRDWDGPASLAHGGHGRSPARSIWIF